MVRCWSQALGGILLTVVSFTAVQPASAQVAAVTVKSVDGLLADFKYLAPFVGQEGLVPQAEAFLATAGWGLEGVDRQRLVGAYLHLPENLAALESFDVPLVLFVPVADEKGLLKLLEHLQWKPRQADGGLYRLSVPEFPDLFVRFANRYAYVSNRQALLRQKLTDPTTLAPAGGQQNTLSVRVYVERFPEKGHERLVDEIIGPRLKELTKERKDDLGDLGSELKQASLKRMLGDLQSQLQKVTLDVSVDQRQHRLALDLTFSPRPQTGAASFGRYAATARSRFHSLGRDATLSFFAHFPPGSGSFPARELVDVLSQGIRTQVDQQYWEIIPPFADLAAATLAGDGLDCGLGMFGPPTDADAVAVFGLKVRDGRKLDHVLRDTIRGLSAADRATFSFDWNHALHAKSRIHRFKPTGEQNEGYLAVREDVLFFGGGKQALKSVKDALERFDQGPPPATPLMQLDLAPGSFLSAEDYAKAQPKGVPPLDREKVRAHVRFEGGNNLRLRFEMHVHVLSVLSWLGREE
jgi:hypothetical protein